MNGIAESAARIRERLVSGKLSFREVARHAELSNSTVREFARTGSARVETVARIEGALDRLAAQTGASDPSVASTDDVH